MTPIVSIVGATAAGKSDLALEVAASLGGEIVNTDAMQVYLGMDIGTAKLPPEERRGIRHHLMDLMEVAEPASVAEFQRQARAVIEGCVARGVAPVLVGGSALYTRAILDEFEFPGTDASVRARYEDELVEVGAPALHARLATLDPEAAAGIEPNNGRRIVRALEVIELTGGFVSTLPEHTFHYPGTTLIGVDIDRPALDARIAKRVERMWADGFVDEVRALVAAGLREGRTAPRAIGYAQVLRFLDGQITEADAIEQTVFATRRFARRQDSWFRKDPRIRWVSYDDPDRLAKALEFI